MDVTQDWEEARVEGAPGSVVSEDGTRIGFITGGQGQSLLMVHGGMCSSARWAPLWPLLVGRFQVTAMDRRGRGASGDGAGYSLSSEYADVIAVAEHISAGQGRPIDIFGHSYGAVCALGAAALGAPLRRLVLYEPPGAQTVPADWLDRVRSMIVRGQFGRAMSSFLIDVIGLTADQVALLRDKTGGDNPLPIVATTMVREGEALSTLRLSNVAAKVTQPLLLLLGSVSPPWAGAVTRSLADVLPAAKVEMLPDQGHEAVDSAPELVASQLAAFLLDE
jgi:pimeloyl-ACP methyl ester carboxylesterase